MNSINNHNQQTGASMNLEEAIKTVPRRDKDDGYYGRVYEAMRGVKENNSKGPDLPESSVELKSKKANSKAPTTLFSFEPTFDTSLGISKFSEMLLKYRDKGGRLNTRSRFGAINNRGFYLGLSPSEDKLWLCNSGEEKPLARWSMAEVEAKANRKLMNVDMAIYDSNETIAAEEKYRGFLWQKFRELLLSGDIALELRARDGELSGKTQKNRGTAFRITSVSKFGELYQSMSRHIIVDEKKL